MASVFTKIMSGELPGSIIYQDDLCAVLLTIEPRQKGHAMVVPRKQVGNWLDLDDELRGHLFDVAALIGQAQRAEYGVTRVGLLIEGYEVDHVHIHLWPSQSPADFDPNNISGQADAQELAEVAAALSRRLQTK